MTVRQPTMRHGANARRDEEGTMTDSRRCRVCDAPGLVHLDRDPAEGPTVNPVVECPKCGREWIAHGVQHLWRPPDDATEDELEVWCAEFARQIGDEGKRT